MKLLYGRSLKEELHRLCAISKLSSLAERTKFSHYTFGELFTDKTMLEIML
jgi:hypothetical protein